VSPAQDRLGSYYRPADFTDAFGRYLSDTFKKSATSAASATAGPVVHKKTMKSKGMALVALVALIQGVVERSATKPQVPPSTRGKYDGRG
jgi:hypothetical protein